MQIVFVVLCVLFLLIGVTLFNASKGAMHEILAALMLLIAAVYSVGAALLGAVHRAREEGVAQLEALARRLPGPEGKADAPATADKPRA